MFPVIVHPVFVNAVLLATPTSPITTDAAQVTAGPPTSAKVDAAPSGRAPDALGFAVACASRAGPDGTLASYGAASSAPHVAATARCPVSRVRAIVSLPPIGVNTGAFRDPCRCRPCARPLHRNLPASATGEYPSAGRRWT